MRRAFTLVELLIVIAVIAILAVVIILILNPAEILKQSRDSNRASDLGTLKTALSVYESQGGSAIGNASTSYVSLVDLVATSSAGDQCQGLGLPSLPAGWTYHCAASSTFKNIDGTGWVPVNFGTLSLRSPISALPVDPINSSSTGDYYTYTTSGGTYELTASLESQKYASTTAVDGGQYADLYETGSNLALAPVDYAGGGGGGGGGGCAGGHNGYLCSRAITIGASVVSGTLANFPMLFSGTYSYLAASSSVSASGTVQSSNGYDIVFTSDSGCSSKLNFEQESYTSSSGNIVDWVDVPSITGGTVIYVCYGNSGIASSQQNAASTWDSNYKGVWHMADNAANTTVAESTSNSNTGTYSVNTNLNATTGEIDGAILTTSSSFVTITSNSGLNAYPFSESLWFKTTDSTPGDAGVVTKYFGSSLNGWSIHEHLGHIYAWYFKDSSNYVYPGGDGIDGGVINDNVLHYITFTVDATGGKLYVDNKAPVTQSWTGSAGATNSSQDLYFAKLAGGGGFTVGVFDEIRVSNTARSSGWVLTEYNNQSSPSTFYTVGAAM